MNTKIQLTFFIKEEEKHQGTLLHEWLLLRAKELKIEGCSVFRSIESYGKSGEIHKERFFELAGQSDLMMIFFTDEKKAKELIQLVTKEKVRLFYSESKVICSHLG